MDMNEYVTSNYIRAEELSEKEILEFRIADVKTQEFADRDGQLVKKVVVRFEDGRGVVLNQTRLRVLIAAFGPNSANWINRPVHVRRGKTLYQGKPVPSVEIEAIAAAQLEAPARPKAKATIESGRKKADAKPDFYNDDIAGGAWERIDEDRDVDF